MHIFLFVRCTVEYPQRTIFVKYTEMGGLIYGKENYIEINDGDYISINDTLYNEIIISEIKEIVLEE